MKFNNNEEFEKYVEQEEIKKENFIKTVISNKHSEEEMSPENAPWADVADFSHAYNYKQIAELKDNLTDEGKEILEKFAQKQSYETEEKKPEKDTSLYLHDYQYACEHSEIPQFRLSQSTNESCQKFIENAISNSDEFYDNKRHRVDYGKIIKTANAEFRAERVAYILASTVQHFDYDERINRLNKEWAKTIPILESDRSRDKFVLNVHSEHINLLVTNYTNEVFEIFVGGKERLKEIYGRELSDKEFENLKKSTVKELAKREKSFLKNAEKTKSKSKGMSL